MRIVTIDFETFYSRDYSLSKMTTEAYVRRPEFEVIGLGVKDGKKPTVTYTGDDVQGFLDSFDLGNAAILCHNTLFDGAILSWRYGIKPKFWLDTLSMAKPLHKVTVGGSLKALAKHYQLGVKGTEIENALGKRKCDFTKAQLDAYMEYCANDVELTYDLFKCLVREFPQEELQVIDMTIRMYTEPKIVLDTNLLKSHLLSVQERKQKLLDGLGGTEQAKKMLMSNGMFAKLLHKMGVEPPTKVSPATGKTAYAFAKTDKEFTDLLEHDNPMVAAIVEARLGVKSTIEETRTQALIEAAGRGRLPIMLNYYGAHCVPGDTELLTPTGWVRLDEWDEEGLVAQWSESGAVEFLEARRYDGPTIDDWVVSSAPYMPVAMTLGHTVPVLSHRSRKLEPISAGSMLARGSSYVPVAGTLQREPVLSDAQTRVLVMVQADGSFECDTGRGRRLTIFVKKPRKIERARQLLTAAGISFDEHIYPSSPEYVRFIVRFRDYPTWLGPERKMFGHWVLDCDLAAFMDELQHWDGWVQGGQVNYSTSDRTNADWVQTIAHLSGMGCSISTKEGRGNRRTNYNLRFRQRAECLVRQHHLQVMRKPQKAYCVESKTGYWLARSHGKVFVTGNTGRFSGGDGLNLQNLPSRKNNTIRRALTAPPGYKLMAVDSSQIEARMVAYLAGQDDLVQAFREGRDVYSEFATDIYGYKVDKSKKIERFVGKTCIAEGTLVLSDSGWKPIETVSTADKLWDGEEWVCHQGLQSNGTKKTLSLCGAWMTPDHQVWSGMQWLDAQLVVADESTLYQVLDTGAENLPSQATLLASEVGSVPLWLDAIVTTRNISSTSRILRTSEAQGALYAPRKQQLQSGIGCIAKLCKTMHTGLGYLTDSLRPLLGATHLTTVPTNTMVDGVSGYAMSGDLIEPRSYSMCRLSKGGTSPILRWIGSTWMGTTNQGTSDSYQGAITSRTNVKSQTLKTVYDILNCGSRNRFTILTDAGPVVVHNCILGLGYGMGHAKLKDTLESGAMGLKVAIDEFEAKRIINVYRNRYSMIAQFWDRCNSALRQMLMGNSGEVHPLVKFTPKGFQLPNGLFIQYPGLMAEGNQIYYASDNRLLQRIVAAKVSRQALPTDKMTKIYGGKAVENCIAEGTPVLTSRGWIPIEAVCDTDLVHDGVEFVSHGGTVFKSVQPCVIIDGVYMTGDHEVLTDEGWKAASQNPQPYRPDLRGVDCDQPRTQQWQEAVLEVPVSVRGAGSEGWGGRDQGSEAGRHAKLRVPNRTTNGGQTSDTSYVQASGVRSVAEYEGSVCSTNAPSMEKLWGAWHQSLRAVGAIVRELLGRYGTYLRTWVRAGSDRQQWGLYARELPVGITAGKHYEQAQYRAPSGCSGTKSPVGYTAEYSVLPAGTRVAVGQTDSRAECYKPVYDIVNAGPRQRFVVLGAGGPFIVHNCVQAMARLVITDQMKAISKLGYHVTFQVHDEIICTVPEDKVEQAYSELLEVMSTPPKWAPDLPVACEGGYADNYGDIEK